MNKTLLVTNDFPPTLGGIQSYLRDFLRTQPADQVMVFASTQDADAARAYDATLDYDVIRWPRSVMLPTPATAREMSRIIAQYDVSTVWFGASAPLGLMGPAAREAGATRVVASTHGHEVGWAMLPGARQALRKIGESSDVITYISDYTLGRIRGAFGDSPAYVALPSAVSTEAFGASASTERQRVRRDWGLVDASVIICISRLVPRKGQDRLISALPQVLARHPQARLVIVGSGPYEQKLRSQIAAEGVGHAVVMTGPLPEAEMVALLDGAEIFAMPARTRGGGLDVEGLGIVYLEAQASGVPVVAGNSGGAPETITPETGIVVDGNSVPELVAALNQLLDDAPLRAQMGIAGRRHVEQNWTWDVMGRRLRDVLSGEVDASNGS